MAKLIIPVIAAAVALTAASATGTPALAKSRDEGRSCFWTRDVDSFSAVDRSTVNIRVGVNDYYQLKLLGDCGDIDWSMRIALESRGASHICTGLDATVIAPSLGGPPMRCPVQSIRKLTKEEVKALPRKQKP